MRETASGVTEPPIPTWASEYAAIVVTTPDPAEAIGYLGAAWGACHGGDFRPIAEPRRFGLDEVADSRALGWGPRREAVARRLATNGPACRVGACRSSRILAIRRPSLRAQQRRIPVLGTGLERRPRPRPSDALPAVGGPPHRVPAARLPAGARPVVVDLRVDRRGRTGAQPHHRTGDRAPHRVGGPEARRSGRWVGRGRGGRDLRPAGGQRPRAPHRIALAGAPPGGTALPRRASACAGGVGHRDVDADQAQRPGSGRGDRAVAVVGDRLASHPVVRGAGRDHDLAVDHSQPGRVRLTPDVHVERLQPRRHVLDPGAGHSRVRGSRDGSAVRRPSPDPVRRGHLGPDAPPSGPRRFEGPSPLCRG